MAHLNIGLIGLGRMGLAIAYRAVQAGFTVTGFDFNKQASVEAENLGVRIAIDVALMAQQSDIIWLMVPAGPIVDTVLDELIPVLDAKKIVIDGGNSNFNDSVRRAKKLAENQIDFLDCGTSGGLHGRDIGFSLMVGGNESAYQKAEPFFKAIAAPQGYGYMGPSGAGHYVKMVHNGIEYALLQAYAEGFHLLKEGQYNNLDLEKISGVWAHGSIIRSWIVDLAQGIFAKDQKFDDISGAIGSHGTGKWTLDEAERCNIPVDMIKKSLEIREWSQKSGGNYATKIVAMFRNAFGGHAVVSLSEKEKK